jgi:hypothetical protein
MKTLRGIVLASAFTPLFGCAPPIIVDGFKVDAYF